MTASNFNSETHVSSFIKTFAHLGFEKVSDFAIAQTADNTALNPKIARLLKILHIACRNHALNLACKDMEANDPELARMSEETQEAHHIIRGSNKLTATVHNVQECVYRLKMLVVTRWNSICDMFESHVKATREIREVAESFPNRVSDRTISQAFLGKMKNHTSYLSKIKEASCLCQTKKATLGDCQDLLDLLNEMVVDGRWQEGNDFEFCKLEGKKFLLGNPYDSGELWPVTCSLSSVLSGSHSPQPNKLQTLTR